MKNVFSLASLYASLLNLYPFTYKKEFREDMLLDFSDLVEDARRQGTRSLLVFLLRELCDFPINLLNAHLKEITMHATVGPAFARNILRGAFGFGLAFASMWTTFWLVGNVMQGQGWLFLLRIANSRGWHLDYDRVASTIVSFSGLVLGALLSGILLAVCFRQLHRIKRYLLASLLGWVAPFALIRVLSLFSNNSNSEILSQISILLIGLGVGVMFSMILQDRKMLPWLLAAGVIGYFWVHRLVTMFLLPLLPQNNSGLFNWGELAFIATLYGLEGLLLGSVWGALSGGRKGSWFPRNS
jgi:hypothetical protein